MKLKNLTKKIITKKLTKKIIIITVIFILILIFVFISPIDYFSQYNNENIFVSIASYRDHECSDTINSIYTNARNPKNIFIGICEQNSNDKLEDCLKNNIPDSLKNNIRIIKLNYLDAKGPSYARYHCSKLLKDEKYFFQIDSHTTFEKDWDYNLIKMLKEAIKDAGTNKVVLSSYPPTKEQLQMTGYSTMDSFKMSEIGIPIFKASFIKEKIDKPIESPMPFCAAGYMFLESNFIKNIPYDPTLEHLFQGEEVLFSARLFTHGYKFYSPNIGICTHHYLRKGNFYWNDIPDVSEKKKIAQEKVKKILKNENNFGINYEYGLGKEKDIKEFNDIFN